MKSLLEGPTFLFIWIGFSLLMTGSIAAFFFWAVRAGQFSQQDRARYLPLESCIPLDEEPDKNSLGERPKERGSRS
jgi:cbb3-type cytochrome oxidase maturation protein